jgi:HK97 family phage major capsid protein
MAPNQTFLQKADIAVSDLVNSGGMLYPEQAKEFVDIAIEEATLLPMCDVKTMSGPTMELSKMGWGSRVLRAGQMSTALPAADRVKPDLGKVNLETKLFKGSARIPYEVIEDNIENGSFQDHFIRTIAEACARDIDEVLVEGDVLSSDPFLKQFDGVLAQATTNVISFGETRLNKSALKQAIQALPSRFLKSQAGLKFLTSKNAVIDYADSLASRQTALGDSKFSEKAQGEYMGYGIVQIPMFPEDIGTNSHCTSMLFVDPKNIVVGIQRQIRIETTRDIEAGEMIIAISLRMHCKYKHEPAVVKVTNIRADAGA